MLSHTLQKEFVIAIDLGQVSDYTALALIERTGDYRPLYILRHLERAPLSTKYPKIADRVVSMLSSDQLVNEQVSVVLDYTGVGIAVRDIFEEKGVKPWGITIHGGSKVNRDGRIFNVPKKDLIAIMQIMLQNNQFKIPVKLKNYQELHDEMSNFSYKIKPETAHEQFSAWREKDHDDMVLAVCIGIWFLEKKPRPITFAVPEEVERAYTEYQGRLA